MTDETRGHLLLGHRARHHDGAARRRRPPRPQAPRCGSATSPRRATRNRSPQNPAWTANYEATKDLPAATGDDIVWADAVIFGSPTRFGSAASQFAHFIDSLGGLWAQGKLADKVYAGVHVVATPLHGGQETTLLALYITLMHFGGIIVPPGYTDALKFVDGNPYGVSLVTTPRQHHRNRRRDDRRARPPGPPRGPSPTVSPRRH